MAVRVAFVLIVALTVQPLGAAAAGPQLAVGVTLDDGSRAAHATIFLNDQRVQAGADGRWEGPVPSAKRVYEAAALPGFASAATQWVDVGSSTGSAPPALPLADRLVSVFEPRSFGYPTGTTLPTISEFATDTGLDRQQQLPPETHSMTVAGTSGQADGRPLVGGNAWLAHPDETVERVPVQVTSDAFSVTFVFAAGPGRYQLEINDTAGAAIVNLPLFVGVPYVAEQPVWPISDQPADVSVRQGLEALQQLREQHGLPRLQVDPRLQAIAEDHLADQLAQHWYCHCWADGSDLFVHARAAGVTALSRPTPSGSNLRQVGLGEGLATTEGTAGIAQLFASPAHRIDLLGEWTHVGIASASGAQSALLIEYADEP